MLNMVVRRSQKSYTIMVVKLSQKNYTQHGGETVAEELTYLFHRIWQAEDVPGDWRRGAIVKLPKNGNLSDCNNCAWGGITLLPIPGKVYCSVLLTRLRQRVDSRLREEQAGFWKGRSCSEQIFGRPAWTLLMTSLLLCGSSTAVALGYVGSVRRLELVETYNIPIFDATSAHQWISCCAEAVPVAPCMSLFSGVTRT